MCLKAWLFVSNLITEFIIHRDFLVGLIWLYMSPESIREEIGTEK